MVINPSHPDLTLRSQTSSSEFHQVEGIIGNNNIFHFLCFILFLTVLLLGVSTIIPVLQMTTGAGRERQHPHDCIHLVGTDGRNPGLPDSGAQHLSRMALCLLPLPPPWFLKPRLELRQKEFFFFLCLGGRNWLFSMRHWPIWESKEPTAFRPTLRGWCSLRDEMKDWVFIINVLSDSILETPEKGFHLLALSRGNCLF